MDDSRRRDLSTEGPESVEPIDGPCLLVFQGGAPSRRHPLPASGQIVIGRSDAVDVRLESSQVSRRHAIISVTSGQLRIEDAGSQNGTFVNGEPITAVGLQGHDVITIGGATLTLRLPGHRAQPRMATFRSCLERAVEEKRALAVVAFTVKHDRTERKRLMQLVPSDCPAAWENDSLLVMVDPAAAAGLIERVSTESRARVGEARFPLDADHAAGVVAKALAASHAASPLERSAAPRTIHSPAGVILTADVAMQRIYALLKQLAPVDLPVLIGGETGTGKELAASILHHWSPRGERPFVPLNCAALPEALVESELFGAEKGAFSGAVVSKPGLLETVRGGTLFLDEIAELPLALQAKLLRVLDTRRVRRLGDVKEREVDFRLIAASHRDLEDEVRRGRFRQDLYFRLAAAIVWIPPLRARPAEIPLLAQHLLTQACERMSRSPLSLGAEAIGALSRYGWPGNVRELKNAIEFVAATAVREVVELDDLPPRVKALEQSPSTAPESTEPLQEELRRVERQRIVAALEACDGNQTRAAELIQMPRRTFIDKIKLYGLRRRQTG
jgi:DNA-binding NtrC family response regulator